MLKVKKSLAVSVLCAVASVGFVVGASAEKVDSEKVMEHQLKGIIVEGDADVLPGGFASTKSTMGILGDKNVMDTPFSQVNITQKTIETFGGPTNLFKVY